VYADALKQAERGQIIPHAGPQTSRARTDHPPRRRRRMRESPQRQSTRQLRQTAASLVDRQAADATRNKARSAAAPISTPQRCRDGGRHRRWDENPLRRARDSRPPPIRCRREAFCRSRR